MKEYRTLQKDGIWLKGNLHNHTNISDGDFSPETLVEMYKKNSYDFIAITDHWVYGTHQELQSENFLIFPGVELDIPISNSDKRTYHIVTIGNPEDTPFKSGYTFNMINRNIHINDVTSYLVKNNHLCILGHPYWSQIQMNEFDNIKNCIGIEIFNNGTFQEFDKGFSQIYFDRWLWLDKNIFCFACDDTHSKSNLFGGAIMVKANNFSHSSIRKAILKGSFYSTTGPILTDFYANNGVIYIYCSACSIISIHGKNFKGKAIYSKVDELTYAEFELDKNANYIYAVCQDSHGHKAWSQPIWLKSLD